MDEYSKSQEAPREQEQPKDLDEAVSIIVKNTSDQDLKYVAEINEDQFNAEAHHSSGRNMRNNWYLWWNKAMAGQHKEHGYPQEKPAIVAFFNNLGIYHADDMSGIILTTFHRRVNGNPVDLEGQVKYYINFWEEQGVKFND